MGGEKFAIAATFLMEVALPEGISAIAGSEGGECAVFSHRGFSIPALDLRVLFEYSAGPAAGAGRVLVGEVAGQRFGLVVDGVGDMVELPPRAIVAVPEGASRLPSPCFRGIGCWGERVVLVVEAARLAALECVQRFGEVVAVPRAGAL